MVILRLWEALVILLPDIWMNPGISMNWNLPKRCFHDGDSIKAVDAMFDQHDRSRIGARNDGIHSVLHPE